MIKYTFRRKIMISSMVIFIVSIMVFAYKERCYGYIMPAEQLIDLMARNFNHFKSLIILQSTQQDMDGDNETEEIYEEQVWLKAPNQFYSQPLNEVVKRIKHPDMTFFQFLLANDETQKLNMLLTEIGVDLHFVALTRMDGVIAYRIGSEAPEAPKLIIEKERFLPLFLTYHTDNPTISEIIKVKFNDYQKLDQGWFPHEITVSYGDYLMEVRTITSIRVNEPITISPLYPLRSGFFPDQTPAQNQGNDGVDKERLKKIIKQFEQKYQSSQ